MNLNTVLLFDVEPTLGYSTGSAGIRSSVCEFPGILFPVCILSSGSEGLLFHLSFTSTVEYHESWNGTTGSKHKYLQKFLVAPSQW